MEKDPKRFSRSKKLSKSIDFQRVVTQQELHATGLQGFIDRLKAALGFRTQGEKQAKRLAGRIQDLYTTADSVLEQLVRIESSLKASLDSELFSYVHNVMHPLIDEAKRIKNVMKMKGTPSEQARIFEKYTQWVEKAKLWVRLSQKNQAPNQIEAAVVTFVMNEVNNLIDRDIQVISDYQEHLLKMEHISREDERRLRYLLLPLLAKHVIAIVSLKQTNPAMRIELSHMAEWKKQIDQKRQRHFEAALQDIDRVLERLTLTIPSNEEHEHLVEILSQIAYLEEELPQLLHDIKSKANGDESRQAYLSTLDSLERETHNINLDLRLTPDLVERLEDIYSMIEEARKFLKN